MTNLDDLARLLAVLGAGFAALGLLASIVFAILDDAAATAQERELVRLTAPLPDAEAAIGAVLELVEPAPAVGRHRPEHAPGTDAQRRCDRTMEFAAVTG